MSRLKQLHPSDVLYALIAFRLLNALTVATFFQPDEYYQLLEPAWWFAFGNGSGAWITWEWKNQLRSALHPVLFSAVYRASTIFCDIITASTTTRSSILLNAPKVLQGLIAALGDYYTFKLAGQIYGKNSDAAWCTLFLTVGSAWQWFCSTRTFSNCLEMTLTVVALYQWPYQWALEADKSPNLQKKKGPNARTADRPITRVVADAARLRKALLCAAFAVILRPTNVVIWITLTLMTFGGGILHREITSELVVFIREGLLCGSTALELSAIIDRMFYGFWTFPAWNFLQFNVFQSIAVFYGNNNWHYYLSQGYPLLLTTAIIWAGQGMYEALKGAEGTQMLTAESRLTLHRLASISLVLPATLSVLSHKEVRFIYPVLPALHILAALPFSRIFRTDKSQSSQNTSTSTSSDSRGKAIVFLALGANILIAAYTTRMYGVGVVTATDYLRRQFEIHYTSDTITPKTNLTFATLMPCHSIPWRSHLQYPPNLLLSGISGWALTCEPPLNLDIEAKANYVDEADIFYNDPALWIRRHMSRGIPPAADPRPGVFARDEPRSLWTSSHKDSEIWLEGGDGGDGKIKGKRAWPDYILFFEQLEPVMKRVLDDSAYVECARFFNSHGHDDWRRKGDVVVWCRFPDRAVSVPLGRS